MQPESNYYGGNFGAPLSQPNKKPLWARKPILILVVVLLIATVAMGIIASLKGTSVGAGKSDTLISLIKKGDGVKSYELLGATGKAAISKEEWITQVVQLKPILASKTLKKVYSQKLEGDLVETAYNSGEKGSIYRIVVIHEAKSGEIVSLRYNKTSL